MQFPIFIYLLNLLASQLDKIIIEEKEKAMVFFQKGEKDQAASKMKERKLHIEQRTAVSNMYDKLQEIIGQIDQQ